MNANKTNKQVCKYGDKCYRKNEDHLKNYDHETKVENVVSDENTCPESSNSSNDSSQKTTQSKKDDLKPQTVQTEPLGAEIKKIEVLVENFDLNEMKGRLY